MNKYTISAVVTVSIFTVVKANTEEEAIEIAEGRSIQGLCHQCSTGNKDAEWSLTGELDGEAQELRVDE